MERELLHRFFRAETSSEEENMILDWLDADAANHELFESERVIYNSLVLNAPGVSEAPRKSSGKKVVFSRVMGYAACVAAVVGVVFGAVNWGRRDMRGDMVGQMMKISVPSGQRICVTLSDGTSVWLNSGTELEYPMMFGDERRVKIEGEALFEVAHDKHPFVVETFACAVEVLGTTFNIHADSKTGEFSTALLEGRLRVSNNITPYETVILQPNDVASLKTGHLHVGPIVDPDGFLWTEGLISLNNMSFEQLIRKFEKSYDVKIVIESDSLPQIKYRGKIRVSDGIEHALQVLQRTSDFEYAKDETKNIIYIK